MTPRSFRGLFWTVVAIGLALDLGTKYAMFRALWRPSGEGRCEIIPGVFRLIAQFTEAPIETGWRAPLQRLNGPVLPRVNQGALFGVGGDFQKHANAFFAVVSVCAAVAILWWMRHPAAAADRTLSLALGLILAGTLGNLFDRIVFHGVRDFLYFYWFEWPVFNFADCFLVAGAGLLLLQSFCTSHDQKSAEPAATELATTASKSV